MIRLLLLVAIANGFSINPGQEYTYQYEAQIATGVPMESKLYSGMKLKTMVKYQCVTSTSIVMMFENPTLYHLNDLVETADPTNQQLPDHIFKPLQGEEARIMYTELSKPVKFTWISGSIKNVRTEADDPHWSVNIKRGLLSLGVMNLEERRSLDTVSRLIHQNRLPQDQAEVYSVMEPSIGGECETVYKVSPYLEHTNGESKLFVTKTRNYMKCLHRASYTNNMYHGFACAECEKDRTEPVKSGSQARFVLRGNKRQFIIESAIAESQHVFTPYSEKGGNVATYINQTLLLLKEKQHQQQRIPEPQNPKTQPSDLVAELPEKRKQQTPSSSAQSSSQQSSEEQQQPRRRRQRQQRQQQQQAQPQPQQNELHMQKIDKLLHSIATFTDTNVQEEAGPLVITLLEECQRADATVLRQIFQKYCSQKHPSNPKFQRIRKVVLDMLPYIGTFTSIDIISEAIISDKVTNEEAAYMMSAFLLSVKPDIRIARKLMEMADNPNIRQNRYVKQSVWLSLGAFGDLLVEHHKTSKSTIQKKLHLVNKILRQETRRPVRREMKIKKRQIQDQLEQSSTLTTEIRHEIVQKLHTLLRSNRLGDKILALKAMGNAGFEECIPEVAAILEDRSHPLMFRSQAIWNLRKTAYRAPKAVRDILLPRFFDKRENEEVRIASYLIFTMTKPPRPDLQMVAQSLRRERNPHVATFVYTHLQQVATSDQPCLMSMAKKATHALRFAKTFRPRYQFSRFWQSTSYDDKLKMGATMAYGFISSPREFVPRSGAMTFNTDMFGYTVSPLEVGFNAEGLQKLLSKLLGPDGSMSRESSMVNILKQRNPRSASSSQQRSQTIQQQLGVTPRESPDTNGHVYFHMFGNEIRYLNLDHYLVTELLRSGKVAVPSSEESLQLGTPINIYKTAVFANTENVIATEAGVPILLKLRSSSVIKVDGSMSLAGIPALFQANRPGQDAGELTARLHIRPSIVFNLRGTMELDAKFLRSGAAINAMMYGETPLTMTATANLAMTKFTTKLDVTQTKEKVLKMEITPQTFVQLEPHNINNWPSQPDLKDMDVMKGAHQTTFSKQFGTKKFGITLSLKGQTVQRNSYPRVPYYPLSGKQQLYVTVAPGTNPPSALEIQMKYLQSGRDQQQQQQQSGQRSSSQEAQSTEQSSSGSWLSGIGSMIFGTAQESQESQQQRQSSTEQQQSSSYERRRSSVAWQSSSSERRSSSERQSSSSERPSSSESRQSSSEQQPSIEQLPQRSIDTSMSSLKQKIRQISKVYPDAHKYGFVFLFTALSPNNQPTRQIKVNVLYQRLPGGQKCRLTCQILRTPVPDEEAQILKMDVDAEFKFPRTLVDPSQLLDPAYQQDIQRQIQVLIRQDGSKEVKLRLDQILPSLVSQQMQKIQSSSNTEDILDQQVNNIMEKSEKSSDTELKELVKLARKQKKSAEKVKSLKQQSYSSSYTPQKVQKLEDLVSKSQEIQGHIRQKLQSSSQSTTSDYKKIVLLKYVAMKQEKLHQELKQVTKQLQSSISPSKRQEIGHLLSQQKAATKDITVRLASRPDSELQQLQQSSLPSSSQVVQSIKQLLVAQKQAIAEMASPSRRQQSPDPSTIQSVVQASDSLAKSSMADLVHESSAQCSKIIRKMTEALIQQEQLIQSLKQIKQEIEQEAEQGQQQQQQRLQSKKDSIVKQTETLTVESKKLSKILAQAETSKKERDTVLQSIPANERPTYQKLQKIEMLQVVAASQLKSPSEMKASSSQISDQVKKQQLQSSLQSAESAQEQLSQIIESKASELQSFQSVAKLAEVAEKQTKVMEEISKSAKQLLVSAISQKQRADPELKRAKDKAESLFLRQISIVDQLQKALKKLQHVSRMTQSAMETIRQQVKQEQERQKQSLRTLKQSSVPTFLQEKMQAELSASKQLINKLKAVQESQKIKQSYSQSVEKLLKDIKKQQRIVEEVQSVIRRRQSELQSPQSLKQQVREQKAKLSQMKVSQQQLVRETEQAQSSSQESYQQLSSQESEQESQQSSTEQRQRYRQSSSRQQSSRQSPSSRQQSSQQSPSSIQQSSQQSPSSRQQSSEQSSSSRQQSSQHSSSSRQQSSQQSPSSRQQASQQSPSSRQQSSEQLPSSRQQSSQQSPSSREQSSQQSISSRQQSSQQSSSSRQQSSQQSSSSRQQSQESSERLSSSSREQSSTESSSQMKLSGPFEMMMKIRYSGANSEGKEIRIQMVGRKSLEQLMYEHQQLSPLKRSELVKKYLKDKEQGEETVKKSYHELKRELNTLRHFHMDVHYNKNDIPEYTRWWFWNMQELTKAYFYTHTSLEFPSTSSRDGLIQMMFIIKQNNEQMDMMMFTPYETDRFTSLLLPTACTEYFRGLQNTLMKSAYHKRQTSISAIPQQPEGICQMKGKTVVTLDQQMITMPNTRGCDAVLVMDCSSAAKFAVKVQPKPSDPQKKIIKVVADGQSIEVDPSSQPSAVKVGDQIASLQDGQSKTVPQSQSSPSTSQPALKISKKGPMVTIKAPKQGIDVKSDGQKISVMVSPYHYSKVCGICGNFDGIKDNEYEGPQKQQLQSAKSMVSRYLHPNQQCSAEVITQIQSDSQQSQQSSSGGGTSS